MALSDAFYALANTETSDPKIAFRNALFAAYTEMETLKKQEREIAVRKAQIQQSINALFPLVYQLESEDISNLSLPSAIRLVLRSGGRAVNAHDIRCRLNDLGYPLDKFDDPLTNIRTAMNRLVENDEMVWVDDTKKKALPGPELKDVPYSLDPNVLAETMKSLGLEPAAETDAAAEKK